MLPATAVVETPAEPLTTGHLHYLEITVNDYLEKYQQVLSSGRTAKIRIPFFVGQKGP